MIKELIIMISVMFIILMGMAYVGDHLIRKSCDGQIISSFGFASKCLEENSDNRGG